MRYFIFTSGLRKGHISSLYFQGVTSIIYCVANINKLASSFKLTISSGARNFIKSAEKYRNKFFFQKIGLVKFKQTSTSSFQIDEITRLYVKSV